MTAPGPLDTNPATLDFDQRRPGLSLFWRTFFLLSLLLLGSMLAWLQMFRALEVEPKAVQSAQELAALVNLTRSALLYSEKKSRSALINSLATQEDLWITPRRTGDNFLAFEKQKLTEHIGQELKRRIGSDTVLATSVNGVQGLWVGFSIETPAQAYWLQTSPTRLGSLKGGTWFVWLVAALILSLLGAALIASLINRPFKQLSFAASRMRDGDFDATLLDEEVVTSEIREVNIGFNRMAEQLSKVEQDRAIMLAGISHDLRTPLARLRLETEMSVEDMGARAHMVADINQLDAIIDKFLDYARPEPAQLEGVSLNAIVESAVYSVSDYEDMQVNVQIPLGLNVLADEVELLRVVSNLLENARRYGKTVETGIAVVDLSAKLKDDWVLLKIRDHGMGVGTETLPKLTRPFFRGDAARTAATGAGLGLAIVEKTLARMGGGLVLSNASSGGLVAHIKLRLASSSSPLH